MEQSDSSKPWLARDFENDTIYEMDVEYIINHLNKRGQGMLHGDSHPDHFKEWRQGKVKKLIDTLEKGTSPTEIDPIRACIDPIYEEFELIDGYSRLVSFETKDIKKVRVRLRVSPI